MSVQSKNARIILSVAMLAIALAASSCLYGNNSFRCKIDDRITVVFDDVSYEAAMLHIHDIADSNQLPGDKSHNISCEGVSYSE